MPTNCWSETCPKCGGVDELYIEDRYGERRGECSKCGHFFECARGYEREGVATRAEPGTDGEPALLRSWFQLPSDLSDCHVEWTHDSRVSSPGKLCPSGFHLAAKRGANEEVKGAVQQRPALLSAVDPTYGLTLLHAAVLGDRWQLAGWLIEQGAQIDVPDREGKTPLHLAAELGYPMSTLLLIEAGATLEVRDYDGNTPLHLAADRQSEHVVLFLLASGAAHTAMNDGGASPLRIARESRQHECDKIVDYLLAAGEHGAHMAARHRRLDQLQEHLMADPEAVHSRDRDGWTPLHQAVWHGGLGSSLGSSMVEIVELLLRYGADVNATDERGSTPLHLVCHGNHPEIVALLLERGASPAARDHLGRIPLHFAAESWPCGLWGWDRDLETTIAALIERGADVNAPDEAGNTPLHLAAARGTLSAAYLLGLHGGRLDAQNSDGKTPADVATELGRELVRDVFTGKMKPPSWDGQTDDDADDDPDAIDHVDDEISEAIEKMLAEMRETNEDTKLP